MFISKKEEFKFKIIKKGQYSTLISINDRVSCLKKISNSIKNFALKKKNNELIALCYFLEESTKVFKDIYKEDFSKSLPRGLVLNIPSSNISMMPFYTWIPSFLSGNSNFIRLSRKLDIELVKKIISFIDDAIGTIESSRQVFYSGYIDDELTKILSQNCDVRMLWGNDSTLRDIKRNYPTSAVLELNYKNRNSAALIDSKDYLAMQIESRRIFLKNYLNDSLSFSFAACSSPQYTFWVGSKEDNLDAQLLFLKDLKCHFQKPDIDKAIITTNNFYSLQSSLLKNSLKLKNDFLICGRGLITIEANKLSSFSSQYIDSNTFFISLDSLDQLIEFFPDNIQTLTYTKNINKDFIRNLPRLLNYKCPDRIVKLGQALSFNIVWDGINFFNALTRNISIQ